MLKTEVENLCFILYDTYMKHTHTETDIPIENQYPKLVRDRIPELIQRDGKKAITHIAETNEYISFLLAKLIEESTELQEAEDFDHQKEEIADVREVLAALLNALEISEEDIAGVQASKADERGGFTGRIILNEKP